MKKKNSFNDSKRRKKRLALHAVNRLSTLLREYY